jgi:small-conductance mechanosensitive channel
VLKQLDGIGFDVGDSRISIYRALLILIVLVSVFAVGRLADGVVKRLFHRITPLDPTERLLGQKIASIIVWVVAILVGIDILGINLTALTVFSGAFGLAIASACRRPSATSSPESFC